MKENKKTNTLIKFKLNESIIDSELHLEEMHPTVEYELSERKHSLGKHPIFPVDEEKNFEHKLLIDYFKNAIKKYKKVFDESRVDPDVILHEMMPLVREIMLIEEPHVKELEKLAVDAIREEYGIDEDVVEIIAELVNDITIVEKIKNEKPEHVDVEFKNHAAMEEVRDEVYKRRFVNAMIQGAANEVDNVLDSIENEVMDINTQLPNKYLKLVTAGEIVNYMVPKLKNEVHGGAVNVEPPTKKKPVATIHAQGMVFPVLIHQLIIGVMELISCHALPKNNKVKNFIKNKADFTQATPWDIKLGNALWKRFTESLKPEDLKLKHHIYYDLIMLPLKEFNYKMREIMGNTKEGKKIIQELVDQVKLELELDNNPKLAKELKDNETFSIEDLFTDENSSENEDDLNNDKSIETEK